MKRHDMRELTNTISPALRSLLAVFGTMPIIRYQEKEISSGNSVKFTPAAGAGAARIISSLRKAIGVRWKELDAMIARGVGTFTVKRQGFSPVAGRPVKWPW